MMHKPIQFDTLNLPFSHKTCFVDFNGDVPYSSRIAIIGYNGSRKSTLIKAILSDKSIVKQVNTWYEIKDGVIR